MGAALLDMCHDTVVLPARLCAAHPQAAFWRSAPVISRCSLREMYRTTATIAFVDIGQS